MFSTAELGLTASNEEFKQAKIELRPKLLQLQHQVLELNKRPIIVVFGGVDGGGKRDAVTLINDWMDSRWISNHAYTAPTEEERERPPFWRFWRDLPANGRIGLFLSAWYSSPFLAFANGDMKEAQFELKLQEIRRFERKLTDDGAIILKFWMHLSKKEQKKRLKKLESDKHTQWQVKPKDWAHWKRYVSFIQASERLIMRTSTGNASWNIVEGTDYNHRNLVILNKLHDTLALRVEETKNEQSDANTIHIHGKLRDVVPSEKNILSALDMSQSVSSKEYKKRLLPEQLELGRLQRLATEQGKTTLIVFEGPDAAGKGGAIRRVIRQFDPHHYQVVPFAAPTDEEKAHHYLWRFWRTLPGAGNISIFDRSWYGRVLVERIEGFAKTSEWQRAFAEINDFEDHLTSNGIILLKFWVHITKDEQYKRFKERESNEHKQWKLTEEDWRNREKWDEYQTAVHDMVQQTSTQSAPWYLIEGNDKKFARLKVISTLTEVWKKSLGNEK